MGKSVQVVTDSTADIPEKICRELNIVTVPLKVHLSGETYLDGVTLKPREFYAKLNETEALPTTSQPTPAEFLDVFRTSAGAGKTDLISIHLSAALSGTYQSAVLAKSMVGDELSIEIIDSKRASFAAGIIVVEVAKAAKQGKNLAECREIALRCIEQAQVYFMVDTLKNLQKGGRIGKASALLGSLLNIKPILTLDDDGEVAPSDKVRGKRKAMARMLDKLAKHAGDDRVNLGIMHANALDEAERLKSELEARFQVNRIVVSELGPVIGTHAGPGTIGIAMLKDDAGAGQ